ncbi:MAG: PRC-barrel domain-containing protein [Alphaproteobacteria bacterium]|nr:PRC-barrel domain-containing protein [Alphaproteobacteria bacterium]
MTAPSAPAPLSQSPATQSSGPLTRVDAATVAGGQRSSEVVGSNVVNEANETVGKVDDLIVTSTDRAPVAVLSVGGFLGIGTRYVLVPYSAIEKREDRLVLRGATKDSLKALPEFNYRG